MKLLILSAFLAAIVASPQPPRLIPAVNGNDPLRLPGPARNVLVSGGGLAGLSAALELAERGYNVTLAERQGFLGGRVATKRSKLAYTEPPMDPKRYWLVEHGFHAWFYSYHNFKNIFERLEIPLPDDFVGQANAGRFNAPEIRGQQLLMAPESVKSNFSLYKQVHFEFKPPFKSETIGSFGAYPLNLLNIVLTSKNVNILSALATIRAMPDMLFYNHEFTVKKWSQVTFLDWCKLQGVSPQFFTVFFKPAISVTLNDMETISAAEMLTFIHLYFISDPRAYHRFVPNQPHSTVLIDPWEKKLKELGVTILRNTYLKSLEFGANGVKSANLAFKNIDCSEDDLPDDGDETLLEDKTAVVNYRFDEYILATNLPNQQFVLGNSYTNLTHEKVQTQLRTLQQRVSALPIAPRYRVLRVWYSNRIYSGNGEVYNSDEADENEVNDPKIIETPDQHPINLVVLYHRLESESKVWADAVNGSVIEFHLYTFPKAMENVTDEMEIYNFILPQAVAILPQLSTSQVVGLHLGRYNNFPQYSASVDTIRPTSLFPRQIGVPNLAFAGDWLATPNYPTALMERAVTTGREAANAILLGDGVRQATLLVTSSHGPGII